MEATSSSCFGFLPTAITNPPFHETPFLHHHHHRFFHCSRFKNAPHPNYRTIYNAVSFPSSSTAILHHRNDEKGNPLGRRDVGKLVVRWIAQGMRAMASELVESEIHGEFGDLNCSRIHGGIEFVTEAQRFLYAVPMPKGVESACLKASTHYSTLLDHFQRELREVLLQELQISSKKKKPGEIGDEVLEVEDWRKTESWMLLKKLAHSAQHRELARNSSKQKVMHNGLGMELKKAKAIQEKIDIFVKHMSELLQIERDAELDATQKELNAVPVVTEDADAQPMPEYLVTHGQAQEEQCDTICNLVAISFSIGLGGVHLVLFRINGNHRLPPSSVSPGDMVCVRVCDSRGAGATSCMQGFVNKLGEDGCSIIVAFESRHGDPTFSKLVGRTVRIDRIQGLADAVTFERNLEALMLLQREGLNKKNPALAVVATLFGNYDHIKCLEQNNMVKWEEMSGLDSQLSFRGYDESQLKAIALGLNKKRPVLVIQGPPGTGKTGLLKELIVLAVQQGERVLVTAPTNAAVDNIVEKLTDVNINVVRVGNPLRISPVIASKSLGAIVNGKLLGVLEEFERKKADLRRDLRQCLRDDSLAAGIRQLLKQLGKSLKKKEKEIVKEVLSGAQVILCTNTGAADASIRKLDSFDLVVIDEAGQAIEPSCWIPMLQGKRTVLAGDHCQLAPVVLSKKALDGGLGTSLMERASNLHRDVLTTKLTMQYRMNDAIASWASKEMYDGCLVSSQAAAKQLLVDSPFVQATWITMCSLVLLDTRMPYGSLSVGCEEHLDPAGTTSFYNEGEADIVVQHVHSLISSGVSPAEVVIQSPYVAQVQLLRGRIDEVPSISGVEVSTIDSFQGREADAVIISMVRSNTLGAVGFLGDNRRMNVAITRARKHVAVVCDSSTICHDAFLARLLQHIKHFGIVKHVAPSSFGGSGLNMDPMLPSVR